MNTEEIDYEEEDEDFEICETVHCKWVADGATTLTAMAKRLTDFADYLLDIEKDGWQLVCPVDGGHGQIENPDKTKRLSEETDD